MSEFLLSWADSVSVPGCSSIFPASLSSTSESRMFLLFERFKQITNGINEPIIKNAPDIRKAGLYDPKLSAISPTNIRDHFLLAQSSTVARVQYDESTVYIHVYAILGEPSVVSRVGRKGATKVFQGLLRPCLKTLVAPFLPTRLTVPGSPRMAQP